MLKFNSPSNWTNNVKVKEFITGDEEIFNEENFQFYGIKGNLYEIREITNAD
jgi:hypothetical protein